MRLALTVVSTSGVGVFDPFHSALKLIMYCGKPFATLGTLNRDIMVWDGTRPVNSVTTVRTPLKLQLPAPTRTIR